MDNQRKSSLNLRKCKKNYPSNVDLKLNIEISMVSLDAE